MNTINIREPEIQRFGDVLVDVLKFVGMERFVDRFIEKLNRGNTKYGDGEWKKRNLVEEIDKEFIDIVNYMFLMFVKGELDVEELKRFVYRVVIAWDDFKRFITRRKERRGTVRCGADDEACML